MAAILKPFNTLFRPPQFKPQGIPRIDWTHPLANGLAYYYFNAGGNFIDLVTGDTAQKSTAANWPGSGATPYGAGVLSTAKTHLQSTLFAPRNWARPFSWACGWWQVGAVASGSGFPTYFGVNDTLQNDALQIHRVGTGNLEINDNNGANSVSLGAAPTSNAFHTAMGITRPFDQGFDAYYDGAFLGTSAFNTNTITSASLNANTKVVIASSATNANDVDNLNSMIFYGAIWLRELTAKEAQQLYFDPYCFLIPAQADAASIYLAFQQPSAGSAGTGSGIGTGAGVGSALFNAVGNGTGPGTGTGRSNANFAAVGVGSATGTGAATANANFAAAGVGSASGTGAATANANFAAVGVGNGTGTGTAVGQSTAASVGNGSATGTGTATGSALAIATGVGNGIGSGAGVSSAGAAAGAGSGIGIGTGVSSALANSVGVGNGIGTGAGVGGSLANSVGVGSANGTGAATGNANFAAVGNGSGIGTGAGTGSSIASGSAVGAGSGIGTGAATGAALFKAAGAGTGSAIGSGVGAALASSVGAGLGKGTGAAVGIGAGVGTGNGAGVCIGSAFSRVTAASIGIGIGVGIGAGAGHQIGISTQRKPTTAVGRFGAAGDVRPGTEFEKRPAQTFDRRPTDAMRRARGGQPIAPLPPSAPTGAGRGIGTGTGTAVGKSIAATVGIGIAVGAGSGVGITLRQAVGAGIGVGTGSGVGGTLTNWVDDWKIGGTVTPSIVLDFVNNRYYDGSSNSAALSSMVQNASLNANGLICNNPANNACIGPLLTALKLSAASICVETINGTNATIGGIVSFGQGDPDFPLLQNSANNVRTNANGSFVDSTAVTTFWNQISRAASNWNATDRRISFLNFGAVTTAAGAFTPVTSAVLGSWNGVDPFGGQIRRLAIYPTKVSDLQLKGLSGWGYWWLPFNGACAVFPTNASDNIQAGNVLQYNFTQPWTFECSANIATIGGTQVFFTNVGTGAPFTGYEVFFFPDGKLRARIMSAWDGVIGHTGIIEVNGGTVFSSPNSPQAQYIAVTYDGSGVAAGIKMYVNGVAETLATQSDTLTGSSASPDAFWIGNQVATADPVKAVLGPFIMSNRARSAAEIAARAASPRMPAVDADTVLYYDFREGSGTTTADRSASGFTGTLSSSSLWP
jgi:hypothetical protein